MRFVFAVMTLLLFSCPTSFGQELTKEQMEPWTALVEQVGLDAKRDFDAMKKFIHPKGCFWGDVLPTPVSTKSHDYYTALRAGEDEEVAHHLVPVSVVVVDDVAIINCYVHSLTKSEDGKQSEKIYRLHNTWKKDDGRWKLLATYNTMADTEDDD